MQGILISYAGREPIYDQIVRQIKAQILDGRLPEGELLPSLRVLAAELKISVITTKKAYEILEGEGLIAGAAGKGYFVLKIEKEALKAQNTAETVRAARGFVKTAKERNLSKAEILKIIDTVWEENHE